MHHVSTTALKLINMYQGHAKVIAVYYANKCQPESRSYYHWMEVLACIEEMNHGRTEGDLESEDWDCCGEAGEDVPLPLPSEALAFPRGSFAIPKSLLKVAGTD